MLKIIMGHSLILADETSEVIIIVVFGLTNHFSDNYLMILTAFW